MFWSKAKIIAKAFARFVKRESPSSKANSSDAVGVALFGHPSSAKAAAERALSLDETLAEAHAALGHVQIHKLDPAAEREFQRALELNPNSVSAMFWYGEYFMGRDYTKGIAVLRRVQELDPLSPITGSFVVALLVYARQPEQALAEARKTLELDQTNPFSRGMLANMI